MKLSLKQSPIYNFQKALVKFKTRSALAETILRLNCPGEDYETLITDYKNYPNEYQCLKTKKMLPNLNLMFDNQNQIIAKKYFLYEEYLIHQVFDDNLKKLIDQKNVVIKPLEVFWKHRCFRCAAYSGRPTLDDKIDLFQIADKTEKKIFALMRNKSGARLLEAREMNSFLDEIGLNSRAKLDVPFMAEDMKSGEGDFNSFATYIAKFRGRKFLAYLKTVGYEATTLEKVKDFFLHLIPFYSCAESISSASATTTQVVGDCVLDSLVMIPFFGEAASVGLKVSSVTRSAMLKLFIGTEKQSFRNLLKSSFRIIAMEVGQSFSQKITKELMRNLAIAVLRSLDPGVEFLSKLSREGARALMDVYELLKAKYSESIDLNSVTWIKIGTYRGHEVHVSSLTGQDGFGVKRISFQGRIVELRRLRGYENEMPVVVVESGKRKNKYRIIDLDTGSFGKSEWEDRNGILEMVEKPLAVRLRILKTEGLSGKGLIRKDLFRTKEYNMILENRILVSKLAEFSLDQEILSDILMKHAFLNTLSEDFVFYWLKYKTFPEWSKQYKLLDAALYEHLRFSSILEDVNLTRKQATKCIVDQYGGHYLRNVINVDLDKLYNFYSIFHLHGAITFSDQFALANFMSFGFGRIIFDDFDAWIMRRAIYKTALRQFDDMTLLHLNEEHLYTLELQVDLSLIQKGTIIDVNEFVVLNSRMDEFISNLKMENAGKVVHKIKVQQQYLMVHLNKYLPIATNQVVLPPGIQLRMVDWLSLKIGEHETTVVTWENVEFDEGKWLADTTNKIKVLIDREQEMYDVLANFDTSLL